MGSRPYYMRLVKLSHHGTPPPWIGTDWVRLGRSLIPYTWFKILWLLLVQKMNWDITTFPYYRVTCVWGDCNISYYSALSIAYYPSNTSTCTKSRMMQRVVYQYYQGVVLLLDTTQVWPSQLMKSKKVLLLHLVHLSHPIQLMNKIHSVNFSRLGYVVHCSRMDSHS